MNVMRASKDPQARNQTIFGKCNIDVQKMYFKVSFEVFFTD